MRTTPTVKIIFSSVVGVLVIIAIIYGSLLPIARSRRFISGLRALSSVQSLQQFQDTFDASFKFYAPVGDEELAKFLSNDIMSAISQQDTPENVSRALLGYLEPYLFKNDVRHLLTAGQMYYILWRRFNRQEDFGKAEDYFLKVLEIGPKLPPPLYVLLELYKDGGQKEKANVIAERILSLWPDDVGAKDFLEKK